MFAGEQKEFDAQLEAVRKSGLGLLNIVNDILDMAKVESGAQSIQAQAVDIAGAADFFIA